MGNIQFGVLHNHSEYSVRDSAMSIKQLLARAKELGAPAVALTDHGVLTGIIEFMGAAKKSGIKPIPGLEAYYLPTYDPGDKNRKLQHLILMAKDEAGYRAICEAQKRAYSCVTKDQPCMTNEILRAVFGEGKPGHGHVIATSACVFGPLSSILLSNDRLVESTQRLVRMRDKYHPIDDEILNAAYKEQEMAEEIDALIAKREELTTASKTPLSGIKRRLKAAKPTDADYADIQRELEEATKAKEAAAEELTRVKQQIAEKKRAKSAFTKSIAPARDSAEKWSNYNDRIEEILAGQKPNDVLFEDATNAAKNFLEIFGDGNFYIELQYHHLDTERRAMPLIAEIAQKLGIPVVAANDAHYATNSRDDIRARSLVCALRFGNEVEESGEGYGELYIRDDEELYNVLSEIVDPEIAETAIDNIGKIVDACNVEFTVGTHYPVFPAKEGEETAGQRLRRLAYEGIPKRYPGPLWTKEYEERLEYELGIIDKMGFNDYLCIVQDFLDYGRQLGMDCPEGIGYTVGPGRGSAVGSMVCYLIGITSVDPMRYRLMFERFLNPERVSMPDIDSDFSDEVRERVIEYVKKKYCGADAKVSYDGVTFYDDYEKIPICSIITKGTMAAKSAIRNAARVTNIPESIATAMSAQVPVGPKSTIDDIPNLEKQCDENPVVRQLISDAKLIEGVAVQYGSHAAGVIIPDNGDVGAYVPLYRNIEKNEATGPWISQLTMGQVEGQAGLLKFDFLGLINLSIITDTIRRVHRNYSVDIDMGAIPEEQEVFKKVFQNANTDSVFQFESGGMKDMLRRFRPDSMEDLVLLVAAYRPGPMQYIPDIIDVKHGRKKPTYIADGLEEILAPTYGRTIYQEQVMEIFHKLCGLSMGEADIVRRAMSKKHIEELTDPENNYYGRFMDGMKAHGASEAEAQKFWDELLEFANYA